MSVSRRSFLVAAALASAAGASAPVAEVFALPRLQKSDGPAFTGSTASSQAFAELLGDTFRVRYSADGWANLWLETRLVEVADMGTTKEQAAAGGECFRVALVSREPTALPQGCYTVDNDRLGSMALLLVPGQPSDAGEVRYVALFNHAAGSPERLPRRR